MSSIGPVVPTNTDTKVASNATACSDGELANVSPAPFQKHRILCVDDESVGATVRAEILREHGYSAVVYHSPLTVLGCDLSLFDLAILDFQMPELNGREVFLRMRALGARFPIVLLTGDVGALSYDDRVLFARCIDKAEHISTLLRAIVEFLDSNQIPDFGAVEQSHAEGQK